MFYSYFFHIFPFFSADTLAAYRPVTLFMAVPTVYAKMIEAAKNGTVEGKVRLCVFVVLIGCVLLCVFIFVN